MTERVAYPALPRSFLVSQVFPVRIRLQGPFRVQIIAWMRVFQRLLNNVKIWFSNLTYSGSLNPAGSTFLRCTVWFLASEADCECGPVVEHFTKSSSLGLSEEVRRTTRRCWNVVWPWKYPQFRGYALSVSYIQSCCSLFSKPDKARHKPSTINVKWSNLTKE